MNYKNELRSILKFVHRNFTYVRDELQYKKSDHWVIPRIKEGLMSYGDCEDFAFACRLEAEKKGISGRMVICTIDSLPKGRNGHMVFESHGYILDVNSKQLVEVKEFNKTHKLLYVSGTDLEDNWHEIKGVNPCHNVVEATSIAAGSKEKSADTLEKTSTEEDGPADS